MTNTITLPNPDWLLLVAQAKDGSPAALDTLISHAQGPIYNLALRFLKTPEDAEDATQEILIRVVTNLGSFRGDSAFTTWLHRIATNHLFNTQKRSRPTLSFSDLGEALVAGLPAAEDMAEAVADAEIVTEIKRGCVLGMLQCLDKEDRMALLLGEVLKLPGAEAATIMEVSPSAYRKRLERVRTQLVCFVAKHCGIVNSDSPCRCSKQALRAGGARRLRYGGSDVGSQQADAQSADPALDVTQRALALLCTHPQYTSPTDHAAALKQLLSTKTAHAVL